MRYRLHVWEHPSLHYAERDQLVNKDAPVEVIYEPEEYDWWRLNSFGDLVIGVNVSFTDVAGKRCDEGETRHIIQRGMFAKVAEEEIPDVVIGRATLPVAPPEPAGYGLDAGCLDNLLPQLSTGPVDDVDDTETSPDDDLTELEPVTARSRFEDHGAPKGKVVESSRVGDMVLSLPILGLDDTRLDFMRPLPGNADSATDSKSELTKPSRSRFKRKRQRNGRG